MVDSTFGSNAGYVWDLNPIYLPEPYLYEKVSHIIADPDVSYG